MYVEGKPMIHNVRDHAVAGGTFEEFVRETWCYPRANDDLRDKARRDRDEAVRALAEARDRPLDVYAQGARESFDRLADYAASPRIEQRKVLRWLADALVRLTAWAPAAEAAQEFRKQALKVVAEQIEHEGYSLGPLLAAPEDPADAKARNMKLAERYVARAAESLREIQARETARATARAEIDSFLESRDG